MNVCIENLPIFISCLGGKLMIRKRELQREIEAIDLSLSHLSPEGDGILRLGD